MRGGSDKEDGDDCEGKMEGDDVAASEERAKRGLKMRKSQMSTA